MSAVQFTWMALICRDVRRAVSVAEPLVYVGIVSVSNLAGFPKPPAMLRTPLSC